MPPVRPKYTDAQQESRIEDAVKAVQLARADGEAANVRDYAARHEVGYYRLLRRLKGVKSKHDLVPANRCLSEAQEEVLVAWVAHQDGLGLGVRLDFTRQLANSILARAHDDPAVPAPVVGENWLKRFRRRHPELHCVKQKPQEMLRVVAVTEDRVRAYFEKLHRAISENGICRDDIWNVDEVGFRIGIGGSQWILTLHPRHSTYVPSKNARKTVTVMECVSASGHFISPFVIVPGTIIKNSWVDNDLPETTQLATSPNGYTNDVLSYRWLMHFNARTKAYTKGKKRLLLMDGHGSHLTWDFVNYCEAQDIIPFCLPSHCSHILQPLDLAVFSPMKHWHKDSVDRATRYGNTNFNVNDFLAALNSIRQQTLKETTILKSWRLAGIVPWNPAPILETIREEQAAAIPPAPMTPSTHQGSSPVTTPRTVRSLGRLGARINVEAPDTPTKINKYRKGAEIQAQLGAVAQDELKEISRAALQKKRRDANGRQLQRGGVVQANMGRMIEQSRLQEIEGDLGPQADDARRLDPKNFKKLESLELGQNKELDSNPRVAGGPWRIGRDGREQPMRTKTGRKKQKTT